MSTIIWQQPTGQISVTWLAELADPQEQAAELKRLGNIPEDWLAVSDGYEGSFPEEPQDYWRWDGSALYCPPGQQAKYAKDRLPNLSARQIRLALSQVGLRAAVESAVAGGDQDLKDWWGFSQEFERNHAQVANMQGAVGATDDQVNQIWQIGGAL